jgi:uncharacterized protein (DUF433 family)
MAIEDERLIQQYITDVRTSDPTRRNEPVIARTGTPVWAVVAYCRNARKGDVAQTAVDYSLKDEEVEAALAYYRHHPELPVWKGEEEGSGSESLSG